MMLTKSQTDCLMHLQSSSTSPIISRDWNAFDIRCKFAFLSHTIMVNFLFWKKDKQESLLAGTQHWLLPITKCPPLLLCHQVHKKSGYFLIQNVIVQYCFIIDPYVLSVVFKKPTGYFQSPRVLHGHFGTPSSYFDCLPPMQCIITPRCASYHQFWTKSVLCVCVFVSCVCV